MIANYRYFLSPLACLLLLVSGQVSPAAEAAEASTESAVAAPAAGKQVAQKLTFDNGTSIEYWLYLPEDYDASKTYPFMLFLHGRGESYGPLSKVKVWGPPRLVSQGKSMPFIIASPQCPKESFWSQAGELDKLTGLLKHLEGSLAIDKTRMYLTGLSMGGYGSWRLAAMHPNKFAAVVPICGGGRTEDAEKLKDIPIWVWHGTEDRAVPLSGSADMVEAIKKAGGEKIRFTTLEGIGHVSWTAAYATPQLYSWMLSHKVETKVEEK